MGLLNCGKQYYNSKFSLEGPNKENYSGCAGPRKGV